MRIDTAGRILIGTTSAIIGSSSEFNEIVLSGKTRGAGITLQDVDANTRFQIRTDDNGDGTLLNASTNHPIAIRTNNTERMRITSAGKVGIGTTAPEVMLDIRANDPGIQLVDTGGTSTYGNIDFVGDTLILTSRGGASSNGVIDFRRYNGTTLANSMRIDTSGRVLIGANTSYANADADNLQVGNNNSSTPSGITLGSTANSSIRFSDAGNANDGYMLYNHADTSLRFGAK